MVFGCKLWNPEKAIPGADVRHEHRQKFPRGRGVPVVKIKVFGNIFGMAIDTRVTPINFFLFDFAWQNGVAGIKI